MFDPSTLAPASIVISPKVILLPFIVLVPGPENVILFEIALKVDEVVQLERFGFCRVDKIEGNKVSFWYTHK